MFDRGSFDKAANLNRTKIHVSFVCGNPAHIRQPQYTMATSRDGKATEPAGVHAQDVALILGHAHSFGAPTAPSKAAGAGGYDAADDVASRAASGYDAAGDLTAAAASGYDAAGDLVTPASSAVTSTAYDAADSLASAAPAASFKGSNSGYDAADELSIPPAAPTTAATQSGYDAVDDLGGDFTGTASTATATAALASPYDAAHDFVIAATPTTAATASAAASTVAPVTVAPGPSVASLASATATATASAGPAAGGTTASATKDNPLQTLNEDLQVALDEAATTVEQRLVRVHKVYTLVRRWCDVVAPTARTIIAEAALPNDKKTVPSADMGGIAGGEKFLSQGVFFKRYSTGPPALRQCPLTNTQPLGIPPLPALWTLEAACTVATKAP